MPRKGTNKKHNAKTKKKNKGTVITVDYEEYDYGDIEEGGDGKTVFVVPTRRMFDLKTGNPITNGKLRNILIHK
jgi:hypothetical protein